MNTWPKWLPYPISWIRAFGLTYTLTVLVKSQFPLRQSDSVVPVLIAAWITVPFLFTFFYWAIASVARFVLTHLPAHPKLAPVRQYLTDRWSGERSHWREGLNAFIISFVAFVVSFLVVSFLIPVPSNTNAYQYSSYLLRRNVLRLRLQIIPIGMFLVSAYLYQCDWWVRDRRAVTSATKAKTQEPTKRRSSVTKNAPVPNPVDLELNQLRAESGMSQMRTAKPAVPEVPEWYVFRNGNAEGPYTKLQLLDVQKITGRTNVRRGEAEWQRAVDIPELVAYLTKK
ncbi:DUF4339 domain-containing protein [Microcoleus sp.]|uniref:DUF4339 domain-containing protein n=1 Tax=Microcoleus sp. TaxID=44472 RepID=UPI00403E4A88